MTIPETKDTRTKIPWSERDNVIPGEINEKGIWIDAYGVVHYPSGVTMRPANKDKRVTISEGDENKKVQDHWKKGIHSEEEIEENPFLALSPKEMMTLEYHLDGLTSSEIAEKMGCAEQTAMMRMSRNHIQRCLAVVRNDNRNDMYSLLKESRSVLKDGLDKAQPFHLRLATAKEVHKVTGQYEAAREEKPESGEGEMMRFLQGAKVNNLQVNIGASHGTDKKRQELSTGDETVL